MEVFTNVYAVTICQCFGLLAITVVSHGIKTSCNAPPVAIGHTATVTCYFSTSIQNEAGFTVERYNLTNYTPSFENRDFALVCDKYPNDKFECTVTHGYAYEYAASHTTTIGVKIKSAGYRHVGRYVCSTVGQDPWDIEPCNFTLKETPVSSTDSTKQTGTVPTTPSSSANKQTPDNNETRVIVPVAVSVSVAMVVAAVIVLICWRKRHTPVPAEEENVQELTPTSFGDVGSDQGYASSSGSTLQTHPMLEDSNKKGQ